MKNSIRYSLIIGLPIMIAIFAIYVAYLSITIKTASASAASGLQSQLATSSQATVGTTAISLFATSTQCTARVITTYAQPLMLTFSDYANQTPSGVFGHLQPASTTVAYDSGIYGCGLVKGYSFGTVTITVSEFR